MRSVGHVIGGFVTSALHKPYLYYYQTRHCHPSSKTSIEPTVLEARRGHQLVDRRSETFTNIVIILINAIFKEFYKC